MATFKRPPLTWRTDSLRNGGREPVVIAGTCKIGDRAVEDVLLTDLSAEGCQLRGNSIGVSKSEPVQLWLGEVGPIAARLNWLKKGSIGLTFDVPMAESVLQQLHDAPSAPAPSNVVQLKKRSAA